MVAYFDPLFRKVLWHCHLEDETAFAEAEAFRELDEDPRKIINEDSRSDEQDHGCSQSGKDPSW
jgi:hypothetical protein